MVANNFLDLKTFHQVAVQDVLPHETETIATNNVVASQLGNASQAGTGSRRSKQPGRQESKSAKLGPHYHFRSVHITTLDRSK